MVESDSIPKAYIAGLVWAEVGSGEREAGGAKYHQAVRQKKKELIVSALEQNGGSVTEAAKALGVHGNYLHRLMRNLDVRAAMKKQNQA